MTGIEKLRKREKVAEIERKKGKKRKEKWEIENVYCSIAL
jgi:hypothetical protein